MTLPQTNYEVNSDWTTLEQESVFLSQVGDETSLNVEVAGQSVEGKPIRRVSLGQPIEGTVLIVCLQHGNEPASREAALAQIRDMAYSTNPRVLSYLSTHQVVWIPTAVPDSFPNRRNNSNGVNPNRDYFILKQPEPRVIVETINQFQPNLIVDAHEYFTTGDDWWGATSQFPGAHPDIASWEDAIFNYGRDILASHGYTSKHYPLDYSSRSSLAKYAPARHTTGLLSETNALHGDIHDRVDVQKIILDMVIDFHEENSLALTAAQVESLAWARTSKGPDKFKIREQYMGRDFTETAYFSGYQLSEPLDPLLVDMHGIVVDEDLFVPIQQDARLILPQILDPASMDKQVEAARVPWNDELDEPKLRLRVRTGGETRDVMQLRVRTGGETRDVIRARVRTGGEVWDILSDFKAP